MRARAGDAAQANETDTGTTQAEETTTDNATSEQQTPDQNAQGAGTSGSASASSQTSPAALSAAPTVSADAESIIAALVDDTQLLNEQATEAVARENALAAQRAYQAKFLIQEQGDLVNDLESALNDPDAPSNDIAPPAAEVDETV